MLFKKLYDESGNELENIIFKKKYDMGTYGCIYRLDNNKCLKIFKYDGISNINITKTIIDLKLNNFYQIYKLLYDMKGNFIGYLMEYYKKEDIDIMTMPVDFTIDNYNAIYNASMILGKNNILMKDLRYGNVIINKDNIIVIDTDNYVYNKNAYHRNKFIVYDLFKVIYIETLANIYNMNRCYAKNLLDIFNTDYNGECSLCKTLSKYKYPIDYINDRMRKY